MLIPVVTGDARRHRDAAVEQLATGKSTREIAKALGLREETVKSHLSHVYSKFIASWASHGSMPAGPAMARVGAVHGVGIAAPKRYRTIAP